MGAGRPREAVTSAGVAAISAIGADPTLTCSQLAALLGVSRQWAHQIVLRLERDGLIKWDRYGPLELTDAGRAAMLPDDPEHRGRGGE